MIDPSTMSVVDAGQPEASYSPGGWIAITSATTWLLAKIRPEASLVTACWEQMRLGRGFDEILDTILAEGLRTVPSFALASLGDVRRVVVRGDATLTINTGKAIEELRGADVSTWLERSLPDQVHHLELSCGETPIRQPLLPLVSGVVAASSIHIDVAIEPLRLEPTDDLAVAHFAPGHQATLDYVDVVKNNVNLVAAAESPREEPRLRALKTESRAESVTSYETLDPTDTAHPIVLEREATVPEGATMSRAAILASSDNPSAPAVLAALCPNGHLSPAYAGKCRICRSILPPQQPFETPRPVLGALHLSTGDVVNLDRGVVMGRAPDVPNISDPQRPHVLALPSPDYDISRNHLEVRLEGWLVMVVDIGSTNGTVITLPGQPSQRLRPHDPQTIEPGTVVTLADEVSFCFETQAGA